MGLLDDAENLASQHEGEVQNLTQSAETYVDDQTGGKFDSEVQAGGERLDEMIDGGQDQNQNQ